jgi:hypothetical protein
MVSQIPAAIIKTPPDRRTQKMAQLTKYFQTNDPDSG